MLRWTLMMFLSVSHFYSYKQPVTYISISNNNNINKFISWPSWTLVVSILWFVVDTLSGVNRYVASNQENYFHTTIWHWPLASVQTWAYTQPQYIHFPNTHTNKYLKKTSKAGLIISIKTQEISQSDSAGIILIIYLLKFHAWIICNKSLMVIACIMH